MAESGGKWKRRILVAIGVLAVLGAAVGAAFLIDDQLQWKITGKNKTLPLVGELAPDFSAFSHPSGEVVTLQSLRGKPTLLVFVSTWCPHCREQMPEVKKLLEDPKYAEGANILAVNAREPERYPIEYRQAKVSKHYEELGYTLPTVIAPTEMQDALRITLIPAVAVLDREGRLTYSGIASHDAGRLADLLDDAAD